jgi:hypothetical protein
MSLIVVGSIMMVAFLAAPSGATVPALILSSPPYLSGTPLARDWVNSSMSGTTKVPVAPVVNLSSGTVAMSMRVRATAWGTRHVDANAGFRLALPISHSALYHLAANWSIDWNSSASGGGCSYGWMVCSAGSVTGQVVLVIIDRTNGSAIYGPGSNASILSFGSSWLGTVYNSGRVNLMPHLVAWLVVGHAYWIKTYVHVSIQAWPNGLAPATAAFNLSTPYGASLRWVAIR